MNDSREWAMSWLADLVGPGAPGMLGSWLLSGPVVVHDRQCVGLAPSGLPEQLRELRSPVADGVPKNGRYAVVYERRWNDRDSVWLEAAEYAFGMFGARFVIVTPVRRTPDGALVADGEPRELAEADFVEPSAPARGAGATARAVAGSLHAGALTGFAALRRDGEAGGRFLRARFAEGPADGASRGAEPAGGGVSRGAQPAAAAEQRTLRQRLAGVPTALVVAVWVGVLLLGVVSAVSLTELGSSSWAVAKSRVSERAAGQTSALRPAAAVPAPRPVALRPAAPIPSQISAPAPVPGDLGLPVPMSRPACNGGYGVIVANSTRPGAYRHEIGDFLGRFSGASYLLAEQACSSLRAHTSSGDSIYAVYYGPYPALGNACATRNRIGGGSYVRKLDSGPESSLIVKC